MKLASSLNSLETFLAKIGTWLQCLLLLAIRLWWGWSFMRTGWGKLNDIQGKTAFFASLHIPLPKLNVILASSVETLGGALLLLGLFTRFATPPLIFTMLVAYVTADNEALRAIFRDTDKFTEAAPFLFLFAALIVFAFGPGKISLDVLLRKKSASGA